MLYNNQFLLVLRKLLVIGQFSFLFFIGHYTGTKISNWTRLCGPCTAALAGYYSTLELDLTQFSRRIDHNHRRRKRGGAGWGGEGGGGGGASSPPQ